MEKSWKLNVRRFFFINCPFSCKKFLGSDDHISKYDIKFLDELQIEKLKTKTCLKIPWDGKKIMDADYARISLSDLVKSDVEVKQFVTSLLRYGVAFITNVPPNPTMTEMAMRRVFPIMKTFYGQLFIFSDAPVHADLSYSKVYVGPHTDNMYFCDAAGLQMLHCLEHLEGTGGESFLVDGLQIALELKRQFPRAYELLTSVQVPSEYIEPGQHHFFTAPIIRTDPITGQIIQLRLNVYDRAGLNTLPQSEMSEFYDSLRKFLKLIENEKNRWTFKLEPGTMAVFDNWRVFHARHAYTGFRKMGTCYIQRTDFLCKARLLGLIE